MNIMKKIILIAAMALMSVAAMAQDFKFGYVDFNELIMLMPEMDEARAALEENQKTNEEILMAMYQEYQSKMQAYEKNSATWTQAVREMKEKEIMQLEQNLQQNQQVLQQEIQQLQQSLQAPIYEKAQKAIDELAKAKGISIVFEVNALLYFNPEHGVNLTPEARTALNIPADRTLEKLQQEMQAKMQAAQAAAQGM
jgi:outer membrane protein